MEAHYGDLLREVPSKLIKVSICVAVKLTAAAKREKLISSTGCFLIKPVMVENVFSLLFLEIKLYALFGKVHFVFKHNSNKWMCLLLR